MANRYANLVGSNKIKDEYTKINQGFDLVEQDIDKLQDEVEYIDDRVDQIISDPTPGKDPELVDIRTPAPDYTPLSPITTAGGMVRDMQEQFVRATAGWRIYNDITELGLTPGTETMEAICAALPDRSELRYIKVTSNPSTAYPASSGMLIIRRYAVYRIELRFINGFANNANEWVGYYDVNVTPNFTGWIKLARTSELTPYESGLWTPDLKFGGGNVDITYSYRYGRYVRIGNVVHWWVDIFLTSKGTATGTATIEGLPFPTASGLPVATSVGVTGSVTYPTNATGVHFTVLSGESRLTIRCFGSNIVSTTALTDANFSNSSTIRAEGKYYI